MPAVIASGGHNELEQALLRRRLEYNLTPGVGGMLRNPKTVFMALFASLGGAVYGYNQGMFGQVLSMHSFQIASGVAGVTDPVKASMLTAILELGAWVGVLANGFMADSLGRKMCVQVAVFFFVLGAIVQACTTGGNPDFVYAGRFIVGLAIGSLSMIVPLYNAELAPPEIRGALVGLQQLAITFGIMISYWLTYGTNFIGGTGEGQSNAAWLVPICIQIVPVLALSIGFLFMPQSPRWLINEGRNEEALAIVAKLRNLPETHELVQLEYLEMLGQRVFEAKVSHMDHPDLQGQGTGIAIRRAFASYADLFTNRANLRRTINAIMIMVFQQWTGVNFILYYAPFIFAALNLAGNTTSLLASGVVGVVMFLATIPAVLYIDTVGRKPLLISGAILMGICHFSVSIIIARCSDDWPAHAAAGWVAAAFIWLFAIAFGFSWGPAAWVYVAECFPLGLRAKGISIGASSNWLNNFAVALSTYNFVVAAPYGAYIFLGMMCVFAALYVQFCTFETKGLTLDEIAQRFGDKSGRTQLENKLLKEAYGEVGLLRYVGVSSDHSPSDEKHDSFDKEKVEDTRVNTQAA